MVLGRVGASVTRRWLRLAFDFDDAWHFEIYAPLRAHFVCAQCLGKMMNVRSFWGDVCVSLLASTCRVSLVLHETRNETQVS